MNKILSQILKLGMQFNTVVQPRVHIKSLPADMTEIISEICEQHSVPSSARSLLSNHTPIPLYPVRTTITTAGTTYQLLITLAP